MRTITLWVGIGASLLMSVWAFGRFSGLIAVVLISPPVLLTCGFAARKGSSEQGAYLGAFLGSLIGCLLLPLLDLLKPFYSDAVWFGPIAMGFALIVWPFVICLAGTIGMAVGYVLSR